MKKTNSSSKTNPTTPSDSEFLFDDCPICQAMKAAQNRGKDLSEQELIQAFKKAKNQGAIVGGKAMQDD